MNGCMELPQDFLRGVVCREPPHDFQIYAPDKVVEKLGTRELRPTLHEVTLCRHSSPFISGGNVCRRSRGIMIVGIRRYLIGLHSRWQWDGRSSGCELGPTAA